MQLETFTGQPKLYNLGSLQIEARVYEAKFLAEWASN